MHALAFFKIYNSSIILSSSLLFIPCIARSNASPLDLVLFTLQNSISDETAQSTSGGEDICLINGRPRYDCNSITTIAEGICLASNRPKYECPSIVTLSEALCLSGNRPKYECSSIMTINEAICLSTGRPRHDCNSLMNTIEALCLARGGIPKYECSIIQPKELSRVPIKDFTVKWDYFADQYGKAQWYCRGRSTGQFYNPIYCQNETKNTTTWPRTQQ